MNNKMFSVSIDDLQEMAECIHTCSWVSEEEIFSYMKACVTDGKYEPEDWSVDGRGDVALDRGVIIEQ